MTGLPPPAWLRTFEAAARLGGFAAAGEELGLTPAAVSQQIRAREGRLGFDLFRRLPRGVALTEIAYPKPAASVLKQVSLTLEPGSRTLITGPSGAGKTTLLKIMAGLYSDYDGRIALSPANGVRGEGQGMEAVYLSQSDGLFDRPFLENLCYPSDGLDPQEIAAILTDEEKPPADRFWDVEEKIKEEAKILRDCLDPHSRSTMPQPSLPSPRTKARTAPR